MLFLRQVKNITNLCKAIPQDWTNNTEQKTDVMFLWDEVNSPKFIKELGFNLDIENVKHVHGAVIWNIQRKNYSKSKIPKMIGSSFYKQMTARNINTVRKLNEMMLPDKK